MKRTLKRLLPREQKPQRVLTGLFRGLVFNMDVRDHTQFFLGLYERETYSWVRRLTRGIKSGIDVGARWGEFSIFLSKKTSAEKILAFEPAPLYRDDLLHNLALNNCAETVQPYYRYLGRETQGNVERLDDYCATLDSPVFLKIDVDGLELDVLTGGEKLFRTKETRMLLETHSIQLENDCIKYLRAAGFQTRLIKHAWWRGLLGVNEQRPLGINRWVAAWRA
jgi:hypothetical protein